MIAIGDIHGCYKTLIALLERLEQDILNYEQLIFLGDYIDRGPRSFQVLKKMVEIRNEDNIVLQGNHEEFYQLFNESKYNIASSSITACWKKNGGDATIRSFEENRVPINQFQEFIGSLPLYYETSKYIFVHAGINKTIENSSDNDLLWERTCINHTSKLVIHGHTPISIDEIQSQNSPSRQEINIDNGCYLKGMPGYGRLVAYRPEDDTLWFQENID